MALGTVVLQTSCSLQSSYDEVIFRIRRSRPASVFSERELTFTFDYAVARPSVVCLSVTFVHPTQVVVIVRHISPALGTLASR